MGGNADKERRENIAAKRRKREKGVRKEAGSEGVVLRKNEERILLLRGGRGRKR